MIVNLFDYFSTLAAWFLPQRERLARPPTATNSSPVTSLL